MKYCVSCRQPDNILKLADEIRIPYSDINLTLDLAEKFPEKTFVLEIDKMEAPWKLFKTASESFNLIFCVSSLEIAQEIKNQGLNFFWGFAIDNWQEFQSIAALEPCYVKVTASLYFDIPQVASFGIPIRLCPNCAYEDLYPYTSGITGTWIRPEDTKIYEPYVSTFEFYGNLKEEAALLKIYKEEEAWAGNLNFIIHNLNTNIDNKGLTNEFGRRRLDCEQRCMRKPGSCHGCETAIKYVDALRNEYYRRLNPEGVTIKDKIKIVEHFMSEGNK